MSDTETPALLGTGVGPMLARAKGQIHLIHGVADAGATYATNGNPVTPPEGVQGMKLRALVVLNPHDGTRLWAWDGSTTAPKLKAYDAFATEEGSGTAVTGHDFHLLFIYES